MEPKFIYANSRLEADGDDLYKVHEQFLPDTYLSELKDLRDNFSWKHDGMTKVASIPEAIANRWYSEGFDIFRAPANEILERLRMEEFDLMDLTRGKRV